MNTKAIIYFGLSLISVVVALIIFYTKFFNFLAFLFLILGVATVLLFRQGLSEMKKKKE
jgi:membrane protein implicated in regulation of membrane protease activity